MLNFHAAHFSTPQITTYAEQFLGPVEDEEYYEEAVDDLGSYEDGVKRTLTDEQISMFRHSEIQKILRKRRLAEQMKEDNKENGISTAEEAIKEEDFEDDAASPASENWNQAGKGKRKKGKKKKSWYKTHVKPDLRKRTWDKVDDSGLESLSYDEEPSGERPIKVQRTQLSYDD